MPAYAILGATGQTGRALLTLLSSMPDTHINLYVRSRARLERQVPTLSSQPHIRVFEGALHDIDLLRRCVSGTSAVFSVVATNSNPKGCSIAQDTASVLISALQRIRDESEEAPLPRVIVLSSLSVNSAFDKYLSGLIRWFLHTALCNTYGDLRKAESILRKHEDWLRVVFVTPGVLSMDPVQRGHSLSVREEPRGFLSYVDLAAGMIEVAGAGDLYDWKGVVVRPTVAAKFDWAAPRNLVMGFWQTILQTVF